MNKVPKIFAEDSQFSKPSTILMLGWMVILIWYLISDFPIMKEWPLLDIFAIPFLTIVSLYYFGKYNLTMLKSDTIDLWKKYLKNK
jgi:hypothetical protein